MRKARKLLVGLAIASLGLTGTANAATDTITPPYQYAEHEDWASSSVIGTRAQSTASSAAAVDGTISLEAQVTTRPFGGYIPVVQSPYAFAYGHLEAEHMVPAGTTNITYRFRFDVRELSASGRAGPGIVDGSAYAYLDVSASCDGCAYSSDSYWVQNGSDNSLADETLELTLRMRAWDGEVLPSRIPLAVWIAADASGGHRAQTYRAAADVTLTQITAQY